MGVQIAAKQKGHPFPDALKGLREAGPHWTMAVGYWNASTFLRLTA